MDRITKALLFCCLVVSAAVAKDDLPGLGVRGHAGTRDLQIDGETDICACAPSVYTFELSFGKECDDSTVSQGGGVAETACVLSKETDEDVTDFTPVFVTNIQVLELDENLSTLQQSPVHGAYRDGDTIRYTSVTAFSTDKAPGAIQMILRGFNDVDQPIQLTWLISFTRDCNNYPVLNEGDFMGWTKLVTLDDPNGAICPLAATPSPTGVPTGSPTAQPTATPTSAPTGQPTASPTRSPVASTTAPTRQVTGTPTSSPTSSPTSAPSGESDTSSPTSMPTPGNDSGGGGGGGTNWFDECFSASTFVDTREKGAIRMSELEVGDFVRVDQSSAYEAVYAFAHYEPNSSAEFLRLSFADSKLKALEVTSEHLLYRQGVSRPVRAGSIQAGDILEAPDGGVVVQKVDTVELEGLYAPLTQSGKILVNGGVQASNYVAVQHSTKDEQFLQLAGGIQPFSHHDFAHLFLSPYRLYCQMTVCQPQDGIPLYVSHATRLAHLVDSWSLPLWIQVFLLGLCVMVAAFFQLLELLVLVLHPMVVVPGALVLSSVILFLSRYRVAVTIKRAA